MYPLEAPVTNADVLIYTSSPVHSLPPCLVAIVEQAKASADVSNMLTLTLFAAAQKTLCFLAEDVRSRDVVVLVMNALIR